MNPEYYYTFVPTIIVFKIYEKISFGGALRNRFVEPDLVQKFMP
jgi:hypothetical protein